MEKSKYYNDEYRDAICYTDPATEQFDRNNDGVVCYGEYFNLNGWDKDRGFGIHRGNKIWCLNKRDR